MHEAARQPLRLKTAIVACDWLEASNQKQDGVGSAFTQTWLPL